MSNASRVGSGFDAGMAKTKNGSAQFQVENVNVPVECPGSNEPYDEKVSHAFSKTTVSNISYIISIHYKVSLFEPWKLQISGLKN